MTQSFSVPSGSLTYEQQKELLLLQFSHDKERQRLKLEGNKMDMEKYRLKIDKQVAVAA